jgi:nitronate monooxygenase
MEALEGLAMLNTELTRASGSWGLRHPLVQAPVVGVAGASLAAAVSAAGGLGMIGVGSATPLDWITKEAAVARQRGRFGFGLMAWALARRPELLDAALAEQPFAVSISFGEPAPYVVRAHAAGVRVVSQVQNAEYARQAVAAGVDALVVQGTEAGGHTGSVGTLPLLQIVLPIGEAAGIPVIAAGGIASGRGIAGVLAMGAAGVWLGTRFVASAEAQGSEAARQAIVQANEIETVHTHVFDIVQELPWPDPFPGRALRNDFTARWHGREQELRANLPEVRPDFETARGRGDLSQGFTYAGQAVGLIDRVEPAAAIIARLMAEAEATLARSASLFGGGQT